MRRLAILGFACGLAAVGQETVAPTPYGAGPANGDNLGGYNVLNSFEVGYRFVDVNGDVGKYRSDVNYGNGVRLLGSSLTVNSRDGHGSLFDQITIRTEGLGNDPYEIATMRVEKNKWYRYDFTWRLNDYYNPALPIAFGLHLIDTQRRLQDHDFTLLPESRFKLFVGYSRNIQEGPALSTVQEFDAGGGEFPLFENIHRLENEYRLGGEANLFGARFTVLHGWVNYSENTPFSLIAPSQSNGVTLDQFQRTEPYRGSSPYWRLNLTKQAKVWALVARYSYAGSRRNFFFDETAVGASRFGTGQNVQTLITGNGSRPMSTGNLTLSFFPGTKLTITNQTSFYNTRMNGNNSYVQVNNATLASQVINFQFLGIRDIINTTDVNFRAAKWIGVYAGYDFSTRRIDSVEAAQTPSTPQAALRAEQTNDLNSGLAGVRLHPLPPLTVNLDGEIGRASHPIFPIAERNYHILGGRAQYKLKSLLISGVVRTNYNINSISVTEYSSQARTYSATVSWTPHDWFGIDAGYSKLHLNTQSGIVYFLSGTRVTGDKSIYISNIHAVNAMAHFAIKKRVDLSVGYSRVQDVGDGRSSPFDSTEGGSTQPMFLAAQTFPLTFESPLARLSVRIHERVRWNVGYQFYHYAEKFAPRSLYDANTGYTSVLWSF
jgi:hypothetical protein